MVGLDDLRGLFPTYDSIIFRMFLFLYLFNMVKKWSTVFRTYCTAISLGCQRNNYEGHASCTGVVLHLVVLSRLVDHRACIQEFGILIVTLKPSL